jgi:DNA-binding transcriptional regulator YdaS (Cro superfamily)
MGKRKCPKPGVAIQAYLERNRISQQAFADKLDVSQSLIHQWIIGRARPTAKMAPRIETATEGEVTREMLFPELYARASA